MEVMSKLEREVIALCDWLTVTILYFIRAPPCEKENTLILPFQTPYTKQSEVAEFGINRLILYCIL